MSEPFLIFLVLFQININLINVKEVKKKSFCSKKENREKTSFTVEKKALFMLLFPKEFIPYKNILESCKLSEFNAYFEKNLIEEYILNLLALDENR